MTGPLTANPVTAGPSTAGPSTAGWDTVEDLRGQFLHHGRYRLLDLLGLGGPSEVWLAHDTHLDRQVAIKTLRADADAGWAELTAHEARTLAQIDHPHVVPIYDSFAERDKPWIVMRFIRGRTLADILETDGPLPEDKLWDVARALSSALAASHRVGIVHRDLKPANVMIGHDNTIWLVDFGIALRGPAGALATPRKAVGTLAYMAPESLSGQPDRPADLWSLGVLLLTLATGANPFLRSDPMATAGAILHAPIPDLPAPSLQAVGRRLLQRNPVRRPTAEQLVEELSTGVPDRIAPDHLAGAVDRRLFRRLWPPRVVYPDHAAATPASTPVAMPATRADSRLARTGMAYWGMSRVIDRPIDPAPPPPWDPWPPSRPIAASPQPIAAPSRPIPAPQPIATSTPGRAARRSPTAAVRHATALTLPVLAGWTKQAIAAFAGFWLGLLCLAPLDLPAPQWPVVLVLVTVAVAVACLSAGRPHASSGPWLTVTVGWAVLLSVGMTAATQLGAVAVGAVPLLTLAAAVGVRRICSTPDSVDPAGIPTGAASTVTALAAACAVAVGPAAADGILVLSGRPAATGAVLLATWAVGLIGVALGLERGRPGLPDLLVICAGLAAAFTTTAVLAAGLPLWHSAFGPSPKDRSAVTTWWSVGLATIVLAIGLAGQLRLGRSIRSTASPDQPAVPSPDSANRTIGRLGGLMLGSLTAAALGAAAAVAAMAAADQILLPPILFVVPVTAAGYVVTRAACTRLAADPPRRVDHRNPARYAWVAGWTAVLTVGLALLPLALAPVVPYLESDGFTVAVAVCAVVGGVVGQLPIERAFRWARRQTGQTMVQHTVRMAAQLASAAGGLVVALIVLAQLDRFEATPQGVAVAVLAAGFGIAVVDLARTGTVASCVFLLFGVAAAMGATCWVQTEMDDRLGTGSWSFPQIASFVLALTAAGVAAVYLVRFAAELTRNTRGERANHAFSALVFAATAVGVVYGVLALAA